MLKQISPLLQVRNLAASVTYYGQKLGFRTGSTEGGFAAGSKELFCFSWNWKVEPVGLA